MFVCAVCKKDFKSKGQMANHETSKAHKKKLKVCTIGGVSAVVSVLAGVLSGLCCWCAPLAPDGYTVVGFVCALVRFSSRFGVRRRGMFCVFRTVLSTSFGWLGYCFIVAVVHACSGAWCT